MKALLALADGTFFEGTAFGRPGEVIGEVVFNTSMTGYQEILTDPSYKGQIVCMTYPLIGNYGINPEDVESRGPQVDGFIVREASRTPSNFRSRKGLGEYLGEHGIFGLEGVDTRALTRRLRERGAMMGALSTQELDPASLARKAAAAPSMAGRDLVRDVTCPASFGWEEEASSEFSHRLGLGPGPRFHVVAVDYGIKWNILRYLRQAGCKVTVVPATESAGEILARDPDGVFLSNGPGDPAAVTYGIEAVKGLLGKRPIFGICLGHQILGLALGGRTFKLKFGHRGANQPVKNLKTGQVEITSQNHGFAVEADSLQGKGAEVTHVNLNDGTVEGIAHRGLSAFAVQYHPEASPGPHDATYLFKDFLRLMEERKGI